MRLFASEMRRFAARRAVRWLVVLALAVIAIGTTIAAVNSKEETRETLVTECSEFTPDKGDPFETGDCVTMPRAETVDDRFRLVDDLRPAIAGSGVALLLLGLLLGTTFIGGDYIGGALAGQLTFEPRRVYLYVMKAVAVAIGVFVITLFLILVLSLALVGVAQWRGVVGDLDGEWFGRRLVDMGRVAAVASVAAAIGYAITAVARRSVVSVVGFLAFAFIVEPAVNSTLDLFDGITPVISLIATALNDFGDAPEGVTSLGKSATVMGAWAAALLLLGGVVFARREIR